MALRLLQRQAKGGQTFRLETLKYFEVPDKIVWKVSVEFFAINHSQISAEVFVLKDFLGRTDVSVNFHVRQSTRVWYGQFVIPRDQLSYATCLRTSKKKPFSQPQPENDPLPSEKFSFEWLVKRRLLLNSAEPLWQVKCQPGPAQGCMQLCDPISSASH